MERLNTNKPDVNELYDRYADMLYRIALSNMQNDHDALDIIHDVFVKYLSKCPKFKDETHEKAWFIRVTVNRCYDVLRHQKIRNHVPLSEVAEQIPDESQGSYEEEELTVMEHLYKIPEKCRTVMVLHYLEGFSVEETAKILRISQSAVKMRLKRGRENLKNKMERR